MVKGKNLGMASQSTMAARMQFMGSDCCNRVDQWQEYGFEERFKTVGEELALASSVGYNSIRIILQFEVWDQEHDGFMQRRTLHSACS
ncbi:MAG: hypothetical protein ACLR56_07890 [Oscillospiraceae bacterium]